MRDQLHLLAKSIELTQGGIQVRGDSNAVKFLVHDRHGENVMLVEQIFRNRFGISAVDVHISDRARLVRVERGVEPNFGYVFEPVHPVAREMT